MRKQFRDFSKAGQLVWQRELLASYSEKRAAELVTKFRERNTWQTPTLILLRNVAFPFAELNLPSDSRSKYVPHKLLEIWRGGYEQNVKDTTKEQALVRAALLEKSLGIVGQMQNSGVKILVGTDTAAPYVFPGFSLHEELVLLVQAGLTPMEAIQAATIAPARAMGMDKELGTIEAGKRADLILVKGNPLEDIHNIRNVEFVMTNGKMLKTAPLWESVGFLP